VAAKSALAMLARPTFFLLSLSPLLLCFQNDEFSLLVQLVQQKRANSIHITDHISLTKL